MRPPKTAKPFYLVWRLPHPNSGYLAPEPKTQHDTAQSAAEEAKRLVAKHPGNKFAVVQSIAVYSADVIIQPEYHTDGVAPGWQFSPYGCKPYKE